MLTSCSWMMLIGHKVQLDIFMYLNKHNINSLNISKTSDSQKEIVWSMKRIDINGITVEAYYLYILWNWNKFVCNFENFVII